MPKVTAAPLSDSGIRSARPKAVAYELRDGFARGLTLRVWPSGRKQWTLRYRASGKQRRLDLGDFSAVTLADARKAVNAARVEVTTGHDVAVERRRATARSSETIGALAEVYLREHARPRKRSADADERMLNNDVLPYWRDRSVREITRRDVRAILERITKRGARIQANRTLEVIRKMLNFGVSHDWLEANPAARIEKPGIERARERVLTDDEIRALWALLERFPATHEKRAPGRSQATHDADRRPFCPVSPALAAVQKLRLVTAQRGGEVVHMRWQDLDVAVDTGWWTIPGEYTKNGETHRVFLTSAAVTIIKTQPRAEGAIFVFAGRQGSTVKQRVKKASTDLSGVLGFEFWSHDLRRTAATRMAAAGVPYDHISRVLNHVPPGPKSTRVYDRYSYDAEKRRALETWARELARILDEAAPPRAVVVPITG